MSSQKVTDAMRGPNVLLRGRAVREFIAQRAIPAVTGTMPSVRVAYVVSASGHTDNLTTALEVSVRPVWVPALRETTEPG